MLRAFLEDLLDGAPARVSRPQAVANEARDEVAGLLTDFERQYRLELPGDPPEFDVGAAVWAASAIYTAAALVLHRDEGEAAIDAQLDSEHPDRSNPAAHYAVDLTMRFLPNLAKLAKSAATDDPLNARLMDWAVCWPLSSVGMEGVGKVDATPLRTSPTLVRLYADRVMALGDESRLDDSVVAEVVRAAIGNYPDVCPRLAKFLETP